MEDAQSPSVLLVDDETLVARLYARAVNAMGFRARIADCADAALEEIAAEPPALLITDMNMRGATGIELIEMLHQRQAGDFPMLLMSADDTVALLLAGLRAGVDDFLVKGVKFALLAERMRFWVDGPFRGQPSHIRRAALATLARFSPLGAPFGQLHGPIGLLVDRARATLADMLMTVPAGFGMNAIDRMRFLGVLDGVLAILCHTNVLAQLRRADVMLSVIRDLRLLFGARMVREELARFDLLEAESTFRHARQTLHLTV